MSSSVCSERSNSLKSFPLEANKQVYNFPSAEIRALVHDEQKESVTDEIIPISSSLPI